MRRLYHAAPGEMVEGRKGTAQLIIDDRRNLCLSDAADLLTQQEVIKDLVETDSGLRCTKLSENLGTRHFRGTLDQHIGMLAGEAADQREASLNLNDDHDMDRFIALKLHEAAWTSHHEFDCSDCTPLVDRLAPILPSIVRQHKGPLVDSSGCWDPKLLGRLKVAIVEFLVSERVGRVEADRLSAYWVTSMLHNLYAAGVNA